MDQQVSALQAKVESLESELQFWRSTTDETSNSISVLSKDDILRYSRQMILPEFRPAGQLKIKQSSALIVGCGGLGCPAALYLASAGVGKLGLVDYDLVEISNLQRQVGHRQDKLGVSKATSLASTVSAINPSIDIYPIQKCLDSTTALDIIRNYDIVLDCTDNVATRYLLNDACVLLRKPLVSGSALRWEGQLTVYNFEGGPTYRCLYPNPPPPESVTNCGDGGVMGAVVGVIGCYQALESIKILSGLGSGFSGKMLIFDGLEGKARTVKLRPRQENAEEHVVGLIDYVQFCGTAPNDKEVTLEILDSDERMTASQLADVDKANGCVIVDVRSEVEVEICSLDGSINIPLGDLQDDRKQDEILNKIRTELEDSGKQLCVVCRKGNDSQVAVKILRSLMSDVKVSDVIGGLYAWSRHVDNEFPVY